MANHYHCCVDDTLVIKWLGACGGLWMKAWAGKGNSYSIGGHVGTRDFTSRQMEWTWWFLHVFGPGWGEMKGETHNSILPWCAGKPGLENSNGPWSRVCGGVRQQASTWEAWDSSGLGESQMNIPAIQLLKMGQEHSYTTGLNDCGLNAERRME